MRKATRSTGSLETSAEYLVIYHQFVLVGGANYCEFIDNKLNVKIWNNTVTNPNISWEIVCCCGLYHTSNNISSTHHLQGGGVLCYLDSVQNYYLLGALNS